MIAAAARRAIRQAVSHLPSRTLYPPGQRLSITSSSCVSERIKSWGRLKASQTMVLYGLRRQAKHDAALVNNYRKRSIARCCRTKSGVALRLLPQSIKSDGFVSLPMGPGRVTAPDGRKPRSPCIRSKHSRCCPSNKNGYTGPWLLWH